MQQLVADGQYLAVFNSTHRVLKAESLLKSGGLPIMLIPAPRAVQADCGLAIRFDEEQRQTVMDLLQTHELLPAFLCRYTNGEYAIQKEYPYADH